MACQSDYQIVERSEHTTVAVGNYLYLFAGNQPGLPKLHISVDKKRIISTVQVFSLATGKWSTRHTTGTPPLGVRGYTCRALTNNKLYYFGGWCGHGDCFHNSINQLDTTNFTWKELSPTNGDIPVMKRAWGGMITIKWAGVYHLLIIGGIGAPPSKQLRHMQYNMMKGGRCRTNEHSVFNTLTGEWINLSVTGQCIPPINGCTLEKISDNKAILFGGHDGSQVHNTLYVLNIITISNLCWQSVQPSLSQSLDQWPKGRWYHSVAVTAGPVSPVLVTVGGWDQKNKTLNEFWFFDIVKDVWNKVDLPFDCNVAERWGHSLSPIVMGPHCMWLVCVGGKDKEGMFVNGANTTVLIELIHKSGRWTVGDIFDSAILTSDIYQKKYQYQIHQTKESTIPNSETANSKFDVKTKISDTQSFFPQQSENVQSHKQINDFRIFQQQLDEKNAELQLSYRLLEEKEKELQLSHQQLQEKEGELHISYQERVEKEEKLRQQEETNLELQQRLKEEEEVLKKTEQQGEEKEKELQLSHQQLQEKERELHISYQERVEKEEKLRQQEETNLELQQRLKEEEEVLKKTEQQGEETEKKLRHTYRLLGVKERELQTTQNQLTEAQKDLELAQDELRKLQIANNELSKEKEENRLLLRISKRKETQYQKSCQYLEEKLKTSDGQLNKLEKELELSYQQLEEKEGQQLIQQLQETRYESELQLSQKQLKEIKEELQISQKLVEDKHEKLHLSHQQLEEKELELLSSQQQLVEKKIELQISQKELEDKYEELELSHQQLEEKVHELQSFQQQLEEKNDELQLSRQQLEETNEELLSFQRQLQEKEDELHISEQQLELSREQLVEKNADLQTSRQQVEEKELELQVSQQLLEEKEKVYNRCQETILIQQEQLQNRQDNWVIDRGEIIMTQEVLGEGAYGNVKVGIFRGLRVAVKSLHNIIISDYNLAHFSREMDIASKVRHPNLVQFIGATKVGNPLILTELMFTSLHKELQKEDGQLTRPQVISISKDVALALNYLHLWKPNPIIHRDVSSPNVLLEPSIGGNFKAKVTDYGAANLQQHSRTDMPGNPSYAAPESRYPDDHSPAMDVYSYCVLLMEMTLHRPPATTVAERLQQAISISWLSIKSLVLRGFNTDTRARPTMSRILTVLQELS